MELCEVRSTVLSKADSERLDRIAGRLGVRPSPLMRKIILDALPVLEAAFPPKP